jgi:hypothetical protein
LIYDVDEAPGSVHDFELCKTTLVLVMVLTVMILADSGCQGIQKHHEFSLIPIKKSKKKELTEEEKSFNRASLTARWDSEVSPVGGTVLLQ